MASLVADVLPVVRGAALVRSATADAGLPHRGKSGTRCFPEQAAPLGSNERPGSDRGAGRVRAPEPRASQRLGLEPSAFLAIV
jgi:hypothetical protein